MQFSSIKIVPEELQMEKWSASITLWKLKIMSCPYPRFEASRLAAKFYVQLVVYKCTLPFTNKLENLSGTLESGINVAP